MNIFNILIPKGNLTYLNKEDSLVDAVESLMACGYTAVPVVDDEGKYEGIVGDGDFLHVIMKNDKDILSKLKVKDIINQDKDGFVLNTDTKEEVYEKILDRNFLSVIDDRNCFIGIVTRKSVIMDLHPDMNTNSL